MELRWRRDQGDYIFYISMSHSKYSTELYDVHAALITAGNVFVLTVRLANTQWLTRDGVREQ